MPIPGIVASGISGSKIATGAFYSIATAAAAGGETSFTFSSIPSTYKSLQIRINAVSSAVFLSFGLQFNGDTTTANYFTYHALEGDNSTVTAAGVASDRSFGYIRVGALSGIASTTYPGAAIIDLIDYSSGSKYKTMRSFFGADNNGANVYSNVELGSGLWRVSSAVSSLTIFATGGTFSAGSSFALYGIN